MPMKKTYQMINLLVLKLSLFCYANSVAGIATLIFYLELHDPDWLENMSSVYSRCTVKCYGGLQELHNAAKKVCMYHASASISKYIIS